MSCLLDHRIRLALGKCVAQWLMQVLLSWAFLLHHEAPQWLSTFLVLPLQVGVHPQRGPCSRPGRGDEGHCGGEAAHEEFGFATATAKAAATGTRSGTTQWWWCQQQWWPDPVCAYGAWLSETYLGSMTSIGRHNLHHVVQFALKYHWWLCGRDVSLFDVMYVVLGFGCDLMVVVCQ